MKGINVFWSLIYGLAALSFFYLLSVLDFSKFFNMEGYNGLVVVAFLLALLAIGFVIFSIFRAHEAVKRSNSVA